MSTEKDSSFGAEAQAPNTKAIKMIKMVNLMVNSSISYIEGFGKGAQTKRPPKKDGLNFR
jgi:hypothetical protein